MDVKSVFLNGFIEEEVYVKQPPDFLRDNHERGHIELIHIPSERQTADILTKLLEYDTFARLRGELGVCYPF